jgi:hypothetical protein
MPLMRLRRKQILVLCAAGKAPERSYDQELLQIFLGDVMRCRHCYGVVSVLAALTAIASPGLAAGDTTGYVTLVDVQQSRILITLSVPPAGSRPTCASTTSIAGAFSSTATYAQQFYSALLTAQSRGTTVRLFGTNDCAAGNTVEDIARIWVNNQ